MNAVCRSAGSQLEVPAVSARPRGCVRAVSLRSYRYRYRPYRSRRRGGGSPKENFPISLPCSPLSRLYSRRSHRSTSTTVNARGPLHIGPYLVTTVHVGMRIELGRLGINPTCNHCACGHVHASWVPSTTCLEAPGSPPRPLPAAPLPQLPLLPPLPPLPPLLLWYLSSI